MPRAKDVRAEKALELYRQGRKLIEIAKQLGVAEGTVRSWKNRYKWDDSGNATLHKNKRNVAKEKSIANKEDKIVSETKGETEIISSDLTEKQRLFCLYFVKYRNKVKAYQKAYECSYNNACGHASELWKNVKVQKEINRLMEEFRSDIAVDIKDLFQWYLDIARADINDFAKISDGTVQVRKGIDGTLVSEISETANGIKIKLNDRMKALDWLDAHIGLADEKQRAEIALMRKKADIDDGDDTADDGFVNALSENIGEDWVDEENQTDVSI